MAPYGVTYLAASWDSLEHIGDIAPGGGIGSAAAAG